MTKTSRSSTSTMTMTKITVAAVAAIVRPCMCRVEIKRHHSRRWGPPPGSSLRRVQINALMTSVRTMNYEHADQHQVSFRIGDVFPESDPVARFVAGIAMMANDWERLFRLAAEVRDDELGRGTKLLLYRLQLSLHVEAVKFLRNTRRQYPREIDRFLETLTDEGRELHQTLIDENSLTSLRAAPVRNQSFHYPQVLRDRYNEGVEEMALLLSEAAGLDGAIEISPDGDHLGEYRFADEVIVQLLPANQDGQTDGDAMTLFKDRVLVLRRFAELAIWQYLDGQPSDDLTLPHSIG